MANVHLQALLPGNDGTGWYAVPDDEHARRCSTKGCNRLAVAYHHMPGRGSRRWRNKYHCREHLAEYMVIIHGRVWIDRRAVV